MAIGIVETKLGKLAGVQQAGKYINNTVFMGVPYAKPPVGDLRWKPPVKAEPWEGVRICDTHAPAAFQFFSPGNNEPYTKDFWYMGNPPVSEDCLYLEITTGAQSAQEKRPVYIWFHGGGLGAGYSYEVEFDGNELANKGIIVVSVGQRLNLFGYMALPQLTAEQGKSGNYGFMDQIMAVEWVKENIAAFGGDPDNITVGGQSGGSLKSCMLAGSPKSNKLISRCVPESGLKWAQQFRPVAEMEKIGQNFLKACGIDPDASIEELRAIPAEKYRALDTSVRVPMPSEMVCDGEYVPYPTMRECLLENAKDIDFLCGTNLGEADPLMGTSFAANGIRRIDTREDFFKLFRENLGDLYDKYDFESLVDVDDENAWYKARELASYGLCKQGRVNFSRNIMLDRKFGKVMKDLNPDSKVYCYLFTHLLPVQDWEYGTGRDPQVLLAYHSSEMFYAFASLRDNVPPIRPWRDEDFALADTVSSYWANFITSGDPNGEGLPTWYAAGDDYGWMNIGDVPVGGKGFETKLEKLIAEYVSREYQID